MARPALTGSVVAILGAFVLLAACASPSPRGDLSGTRTVFHNPYATLERFERTMQGGIHASAGPIAIDANGNRTRLRREERRAMRERRRAINSILVLHEAFENDEPIPGRFTPSDFESPASDRPVGREGGGHGLSGPAAPPQAAPAQAAPARDAPAGARAAAPGGRAGRPR